MTANNTICGATYGSVSTDTMGRLRPCCTINSPLKDSNVQPYRIDKIGDLERFWSSDIMKEIRKAGIEGKWHKLCYRCEDQEQGGSFSQRQLYNYLLPKNATINPIPDIKMLNLLLSNKCNMKCRMCSPKNSHLIGKESSAHGLKHLWGNDVWGDDQTSTYSTPVSIDDAALVDLIEAYSHSLNEIQFTGGEPFLSDTQHIILKKLIDLNISKNITITYNTNGTIPMDSYFDMWSKFKKVSISVSLDACNDLANYIRYPTNWNNVNKIMKSLDTIQNNVVFVKVNCLVQALNVLRLDELVEWLDQFDNICRIPSFSTLIMPKHHHLRNIPLDLRKESSKKLMHKLEKIDIKRGVIKWPYDWNLDRMIKTIYYLGNEPTVTDASPFIKFNTELDKVRKLDLFTVLPELKGMIAKE